MDIRHFHRRGISLHIFPRIDNLSIGQLLMDKLVSVKTTCEFIPPNPNGSIPSQCPYRFHKGLWVVVISRVFSNVMRHPRFFATTDCFDFITSARLTVRILSFDGHATIFASCHGITTITHNKQEFPLFCRKTLIPSVKGNRCCPIFRGGIMPCIHRFPHPNRVVATTMGTTQDTRRLRFRDSNLLITYYESSHLIDDIDDIPFVVGNLSLLTIALNLGRFVFGRNKHEVENILHNFLSFIGIERIIFVAHAYLPLITASISSAIMLKKASPASLFILRSPIGIKLE